LSALRRAVRLIRHHSRIWNLFRAICHLSRGRRIAPGAWVVVEGAIRLGRGASILDGCRVLIPAGGVLELGEGVWINRGVQIDVLREVVLGPHTTVQRNCSLIGDVKIGRGCLLAPNVFISSGRHYFDQWPALPIRVQDARVASDARLSAQQSRPVRIEDDCWLGTNVLVQAGVTVGRGAVVGANSVVTADVAPYEVVAGVPARRLRSRLDFTPPRELDGMSEAHLPYFYDGFLTGAELPPVAEGNFVLALELRDATAVRVSLRNVGVLAARVQSGGIARDIPVGEALDIDIPLGAERQTNRLHVSLSAQSHIAVLRAAAVRSGEVRA
jgi:acetyltransferase-like isoleucine patch superfamily enzyme